jgi:hypothetical protein
MPKGCIPKLLCQYKLKIWKDMRNVQLQSLIILILITETGRDTCGTDYGSDFLWL